MMEGTIRHRPNNYVSRTVNESYDLTRRLFDDLHSKEINSDLFCHVLRKTKQYVKRRQQKSSLNELERMVSRLERATKVLDKKQRRLHEKRLMASRSSLDSSPIQKFFSWLVSSYRSDSFSYNATAVVLLTVGMSLYASKNFSDEPLRYIAVPPLEKTKEGCSQQPALADSTYVLDSTRVQSSYTTNFQGQ